MRPGLLALAGVLLFAASPAHAALTLCNRTSYVLYAATAVMQGQKAQTQGWTRITPGECQVSRKEALTASSYLVHARSSLSHAGPARAWGGGVSLCVKDPDFSLTQSGAGATCREEGSFALPFAVLATGGRANWTMTLDEQPALPTLTAAQLAGVKRLLRDNGYDPGPVTGALAKQTGAALAAFRKAKNADRLDNASLFALMESESRKINAPAGYTVCNDGAAVLDVALAELGKSGTVTRGWWTVPRGGCARAITTPLTGKAYYLLARRKDGGVVLGGPEKFCIAPAAFEIRARGDCAAHGQQEAGFARTQTRGLPGYTARVGTPAAKPR